MLTGELPIGRFALPSEKPGVDPRLDPIVLKALEKEKERRYRSVGEVKTSVQQLAGRPVSSPSSPPSGSSQPPRTAHAATASFVLTLLSFVPGLLILSASWFAVSTFQVNEAQTTTGTIPAMMLVTLVFVALAIPGFALGTWALAEVRKSGGILRGVTRALFGVLAWPVLILVGAVGYVLAGVFGGFIPNSPGFAWRLGFTAIFSAAAAAGFLTLTRRFVLNKSARDSNSWLFFLLLIPLLVPFGVVAAFISGAMVAASSVSSNQIFQAARPTSIQTAVLVDDNSSPMSRKRGALSSEFSIPAGHGAIAELVVSDRAGQTVLPGSGVFLLAHPSQEARGVVSWVPAPDTDQLGEAHYVRVAGGADPFTARTNNATRFVLPSAAATLFQNRVIHMSAGSLGTGVEEVHWFIQRNGPEPGVGVYLRLFPHSLSGDLISESGYSGFGTNWLEEVQR